MWNFMILGNEFYKIFYCFIIYCFVGWIWETCYVSVKDGKLANRGFMTGPVIPIYGCAATGILLAFYNPALGFLTTEKTGKAYLMIFLIGAVVASSIEYFTSFIMEKLFHAKWWDYSDTPLNINGRICVPASIFWGIMAIVLVKALHPLVFSIIDSIPRRPGEIVGYVIVFLFLFDLTATVAATIEIENKVKAISRIKKEVTAFTSNFYDKEVSAKIGFKDKYGETAVGDIVEHAFDRVDATYAFTKEMVSNKKDDLVKGFQNNVDKVDKVLADNKEQTEKFVNDSKDKISGILHSIRKFPEFTAKRLKNAFPGLKAVGDKEGALKTVTDYFSSLKSKIGTKKENEDER